MKIYCLKPRITRQELERIAQENYGEMIKGVVDIRQGTIALGGELHADGESFLLEQGSQQEDLWGFNVYPKKSLDERIEYTSFINIRPKQNNRALEIKDAQLKQTIKAIVDKLID